MRTSLIALIAFVLAPSLAAAQDVAVTSPAVRTAVAFSADRHGQATADGGRYDHYGYTAAHPTLPFGTRLHLKRMDDDRSVIVRVADRPPDGFSLIVSGASAQVLGVLHQSALVEQIVLGAPVQAAASPLATASNEAVPLAQPAARTAARPSVRYALQLAAFHDAHFAQRFAARTEGARVETTEQDGTPIHRVFFGDYPSRAEALAASETLAGRGFDSLIKTRRSVR